MKILITTCLLLASIGSASAQVVHLFCTNEGMRAVNAAIPLTIDYGNQTVTNSKGVSNKATITNAQIRFRDEGISLVTIDRFTGQLNIEGTAEPLFCKQANRKF